MNIYNYIESVAESRGAAYFILIDPDKLFDEKLIEFVKIANNSGVDGFLIGGSLMLGGDLEKAINKVKSVSKLPVVIFPGSVSQVTPNADAVLFISLISGRNASQLIGEHVLAAPIIKKYGIEPISTGYMLIESGKTTTAEYISNSKPIPRNKKDIAVATALAGEYLGMKMIYLEGGSGAELSVPTEMVKAVTTFCSIPVIVGGGIRTPEDAKNKVLAGAKMIVTGNFFEIEKNWDKLKEFSKAIHVKEENFTEV